MSNRIFENFTGEHITILLNKDTRQTVEIDGRLQIIQSPALVEGYLIDEDEEFYYLGPNPDSFNQAVNKRYIVHIEISKEETKKDVLHQLEMLLDSPDEDTGLN